MTAPNDSPPAPATVLAIVLTFDAPASLHACLEALDRQTRPVDEILIIDNAGPSDAAAVVDAMVLSVPVRVERTSENLGPAGGHARGLELFLEGSCTHAWVMDDDIVAVPDALEALLDLASSSARPPLVEPVCEELETGRHLVGHGWWGVLVPREVVVEVGLPRAELFWWTEDTEYLRWRIPQAGVPVVVTERPVVQVRRQRESAEKPAWKYYYEARNQVYHRLWVQRRSGGAVFPKAVRPTVRAYRSVRAVVKLLIRSLTRERHGRLDKAGMVVRGTAHGVRGRLGVTIPVDRSHRPTVVESHASPGAHRVLHVLPMDLARGAQAYASELRSVLDRPDQLHRTVAIFTGERGTLNADIELGVSPRHLRRFGLSPVALFRLWRLVRRQDPVAIVAHGSEPFVYGALVKPRAAALVYYRIGVSTEALARPVRRAAYRLLMRRVDAVAGVSTETLDDAVALLGATFDRVTLIPNGRDPDAFRLSDQHRSPPRVVWVGHFTVGKRPEAFISAVADLRGRGLDLEAEMIGDGPLLDRLVEVASGHRVELLGRRDDVPERLADAQIFCFTSSGESEGLPGVLVEAGMAGLATVTTRVPGAATVVQDGITGYVVDLGDDLALVDRLEQLVLDAEMRARMGAAARRRCEADFSEAASFALWRELLDQTIDSRASR